MSVFSKAAAQSKDQHVFGLFTQLKMAFISHRVKDTSEAAADSQQCGVGVGEVERVSKGSRVCSSCPIGESEILIPTKASCLPSPTT